jgi:outer membrane receptor protein involved in Fe transport
LASLLAAPAGPAAGATESVLPVMTVTGTREGELLSETSATVGFVRDDVMRATRPAHPKDVLNQIPGVWFSNLSGEGHATAIRQPLTTSAVYLYLEDGIPTRSTGFFNHNALYEINVPQSGGVEVMKGPGSALYGSDAIGGTINVLTRTPPRQAERELSGEVGSYGWARVLMDAGNTLGDDAWRASVNLTHTDGWHDNAGYERRAGTARWDRVMGDEAILKTLLSFSTVDQRHVGKLSEGEYAATPRANNVPFSYRKVDALRLSTAYEKETADTLLSITPYLRDNRMEIVPNWSVGYDPSQYRSENTSFGFLSKYRRDYEPMRARLIVGLDFDYSPGSRDEDSIKLDKTTNPYGGTTYRLDPAIAPVRIYRYDVRFRSLSPYIHGEASLSDKLRLNAGLRYDDMRYDYENTFNNGAAGATQGVAGAFPAGGWYGHVASTQVGYRHWGPKLGASYAFSTRLNGFATYRNSFRTPSESQVFRGSRESTAVKAQAAAESLLRLRPVIVDNLELGLRGESGGVGYEASLYYMTKKDDIVSYTDPLTTQRTVVNAGKTLHRGLELSAAVPLAADWALDMSLSYAQHRYETWRVSGAVDYSGREMEAAPRVIANTRLSYSPGYLNGGRVQLEWFRLGSYWLDAANTGRYRGHSLVNLRASYPFARDFELFGSISNLFDRRYAETADGTGAAPTYTSGLPRSLALGLQAKW